MFTGIIEQTGTLIGLKSSGGVRRITIEAPGLAARLREGDSLGVSGVCLTALDVNPTFFHADLAQETLDCTSLGALVPGAEVNLELPTAAGSPLGGHIVQGHVDGTGTLASLEPVIPESSPQFSRETTDWTLKVKVPEIVHPWMVHKGSVAIEGISLTIAEFDGEIGHHCDSAPDLLAHQPAHALTRRSGECRGRCAGEAGPRPTAGPEEAAIGANRGLAGGQRILVRFSYCCRLRFLYPTLAAKTRTRRGWGTQTLYLPDLIP
jgi:riboflavin synthase